MTADPEATLAPAPGPVPSGPPVTPPGSLFGSPAPVRSDVAASLDDAIFGSATPTAGMAWAPGPPDRPGSGSRPSVPTSRRKLFIAAAAVAIVLAGGIVYALGGGNGRGAASPGASTGTVTKPTVHMLPAGRTGGRAQIPWPLIGPGWTLAEVSTAQPDANGAATSGGRNVIYLVDPEGGKYRITSSAGTSAPQLIAWSGDATMALYATGGTPAGSTPGYGLLKLSSGTLNPLPLPTGVTALGFTRPDGLNILAVRQRQGKYLLQRFTLAGDFAATIGSMPRPAAATDVLQGNALSSPDGTTAVWGVSGHEMQLVSNAGGLVRRLRVPGTGTPPSCTPLSWWDTQTVLAYCNAAGTRYAGQLWLVPSGGSSPTQLTSVSGSASGVGDLTGGWQAAGTVYVTATTAAQCSTAASGPGGQQILQLSQGGAEQPVRIPGSTSGHDGIVAGVNGRLLVLTQTSCPGTSSLVWYDPATHVATPVLTAPAGQVGVVDAVPYGSGPAATTNGLG
jgi:TolB protein